MNEELQELLKTLIEKALETASTEFVSEPLLGDNIRNYLCCIEECNRLAYAKNLCNAHYIRQRKGKNLATPLTNRRRLATCVDCGELTTGKGGWGRCTKHYKLKRRSVIKSAIVKGLGSVCSKCKLIYPSCVFDFHHISNKLAEPSLIIANGNTKNIAEELSKCVLLCANCHRMEHNNEFI